MRRGGAREGAGEVATAAEMSESAFFFFFLISEGRENFKKEELENYLECY